ncbi:N-acetylmuramoyl-L-alanine amidase CwlD [Clostridia bacterium]|nr:N-acetylmuramoyl-L-alanine amidase CwlD [Clostridia bacterium]
MKKTFVQCALPYILVLLGLVLVLTIFFTSRSDSIVGFSTTQSLGHVVVIDAGHGGLDGGAVSISGMLESGINLEIAKKTDALMRFLGYNTVMLRDTDSSLHDPSAATIAAKKRSDLNNRVKLVGAIPNAVLISIHQNFFQQSQYHGAQIFWNNVGAAQGFAEVAQEKFLTLDPDNRRAAKPVGNVFLMTHVKCPAILAECGFLSNAGDEKNLTDASYQIKVAAVLTASFVQWEMTDSGKAQNPVLLR